MALLCMIATAASPLARADDAAKAAADIAGNWEGVIDLPGMPLKTSAVIRKAEGGWKGSLSIPAQNAKDLPLTEMKLEGGRWTCKLPDAPGNANFEGELSADGREISGKLNQAGQQIAFKMTRGASTADNAAKLAGFDAWLDETVKKWGTAGVSVGIVMGDEVVFCKGAGFRDVEKKLPVTGDTLFAIGSSSKAFTTFLLGLLVDEGKLDWDKPIREYIPEFQLHSEYASAQCNARDLVTHRSGLPRHDLTWYGNEEDSRETMIGRLQYLKPTKELRQLFQYNNLMYMVAGYAAGKIAGCSWEDAIRKRIFEPLGMKRSLLAIKAMATSDDAATGYRYDLKTEKLVSTPYREVASVAPAGSICSSAREMCQWLRVQASGGKLGEKQIIAPDTLKDMHAPHMAMSSVPADEEDTPGSYGLGWFIDTYRGEYRVHHGGAIDGFMALVTVFPRKNLGVVVLVNESGSPLPGLVTQHAVDRLLGFEQRDWAGEALVKRDASRVQAKAAVSNEKRDTARVKDTKPSRPIADFAGEYEHPGYGVITISPREGGLSFKLHEHQYEMNHWHYDVFELGASTQNPELEYQKIRFISAPEGRISGLGMLIEPAVGELVFSRRVSSKMRDAKYLGELAGRYDLGPQVVEFRVKGDLLTASLPGQPMYTLVPQADDEFSLRELPAYSVRFTKDGDGKRMAMILQPDGVFEAKRVE
ncbi:MAG: serine hydrolase [Phycisphaerae bacterium]|nr:serine hydrolase [Phycisphaerae bacterium]